MIQEFLFLVTANGIAVKFPLDDLGSKGRNSRGVRGIKLKKDDIVISADVVTNEDLILLVTEHGIGKLVEVSDFRTMKRGAVGVKGLETTRKTGKVVAAITILDKYDGAMLLSNGGQMIRIKTATIPIYKRQAQGIRLMKLKEGEKIVSGTRIANV
jgi:DNA gyrase subunit A